MTETATVVNNNRDGMVMTRSQQRRYMALELAVRVELQILKNGEEHDEEAIMALARTFEEWIGMGKMREVEAAVGNEVAQ